MVGQPGLNIEEQLYEYVRVAYSAINTSFYRPLTEDLIIHLVGSFGLDILKKTKFIEETAVMGQYVLCCER